jgi:hypothetical protein
LLNGDAHLSEVEAELRIRTVADVSKTGTAAEYHKEPHTHGHFSSRLRTGVREGTRTPEHARCRVAGCAAGPRARQAGACAAPAYLAPDKGRKNVAHGASRGTRDGEIKRAPERGERYSTLNFFRPFQGLSHFNPAHPKADAVGYILPPPDGALQISLNRPRASRGRGAGPRARCRSRRG